MKKEIKKLNRRQEKFCKVFTGEKEFFGNGVQSYLEVYDINKKKPNWYRAASAASSRLLSNVKIIDRITELLEQKGLSDVHVDKQLLFLLNQYADFSSKLGAIKEYNKLKQRIVEKTDITSGGKPIPLLANLNVSNNNSNKEDSEVKKES